MNVPQPNNRTYFFGMRASSLFIVIAAILILPASFWLAERRNSRHALDFERVDLERGLTIQRKRIDSFISRVGAESLSENEERLASHEDLLIRIGSRSNDINVESMYSICLGNRRLARLHEESAHRGDGDIVAERVFSVYLQRLMADMHETIGLWEKGTPPQKPRKWQDLSIAVSAGLFLSAEYQRPAVFLKHLDEWIAAGEGIHDRILQTDWAQVKFEDAKYENYVRKLGENFPEQKWGSMKTAALPEKLFILNLYVRVLERWIGSETALNSVPDMFLQQCPPVRVPFIGWDGHTNTYDFTHQSAGVPIDQKRIIREYTVFERWGIAIDEPLKDEIVHAVRKNLDRKLIENIQQTQE